MIFIYFKKKILRYVKWIYFDQKFCSFDIYMGVEMFKNINRKYVFWNFI